ncbi:MAG TPA: YegP family protein [Anaerolineales bacterium]|nr:YegP family protein [Anaerolineales bacterium]
MAKRFEIKKAVDQQYYFALIADNNEIILDSERYVQKQGALNGVEAVKKNAQNEARYDRRDGQNGQFYFVLKAANGEVIGRSEQYKTRQGVESGIAAVKAAAADAPVKDLT